MSSVGSLDKTGERYGATIPEWTRAREAFGLEYLQPVVSNPNARISPDSGLKELGKAPSEYNGRGEVRGIAGWTAKRADVAQFNAWRKVPDLGICVQTHHVRAIDIDVDDPDKAAAIRDAVVRVLEDYAYSVPVRTRPNSARCILVFKVPGEIKKRRVSVAGGVVEFLGSGEQFVAYGTHKTGVKYQWSPDAFEVCEITPEQLEEVWAVVCGFAVDGSVTSSPAAARTPTLEAVLYEADREKITAADMLKVEEWLHALSAARADDRHQWVQVLLAVAFAKGTEFEARACELAREFSERSDKFDPEDFERVWESAKPSRIKFGSLKHWAAEDTAAKLAPPKEQKRFVPVPASQLKLRPRPGWWIKSTIPKAELVVLFGASGSGKSFLALDMGLAIARGVDWRGYKTRQGRVVYMAGEGVGGVPARLQAYEQRHGISECPIDVIEAMPNLLQATDVVEFLDAAEQHGPYDVLIIDTLATAVPGGNENSAEDMGRALGHVKTIHQRTGATVIVVAHSGKDETRGVRGWSGIRAAADAELEVVRAGEARSVTVTKQKDGRDGVEMPFTLESVLVGVDEDGDGISSLVVSHGHGVGVKAQREKTKGLKDVQLHVLAEFERMHEPETIDGKCDPLPVKVADLISECMPWLRSRDRESGRERPDSALRKVLRQSIDSLIERHLVVEQGEGLVGGLK